MTTAASASDQTLLSVLVVGADAEGLGAILAGVLQTSRPYRAEVVVVDDATTDGAWEVALEIAGRHPAHVTLQRNRVPQGPDRCLDWAVRLATGTFALAMRRGEALPKAALDCWREGDHGIRGLQPPGFFRLADVRWPAILRSNAMSRLAGGSGPPLASVLCHNYNYGRFLGQALESALAQTYPNVEISFSDNASTDESWAIAVELDRRMPGRMCLVRNRSNRGPDFNFRTCRTNMGGEYYVSLCSDDVLMPDFVERAARVLEERPTVGLVLAHRGILDEEGRRSDEPPFYNSSCVIPGGEQAAVYMMAAVNPSVSQILYRSSLVDERDVINGLATRYYGSRILDFNLCLDHDFGYLHHPLVLHRLHSSSDTSRADEALLPVIGMYVLNLQFADAALARGQSKAAERLPASFEKLGRLAIRYSVRSLLMGRDETARRYYYLAAAISPALTADPTWVQLASHWSGAPQEREALVRALQGVENLATRTVSYDPPPGSVTLAS
jgi:glycosyltransferase involved in cell wall biosynthesis